jgi:subfamily B ATP-binding cassette protein MsbA
MFRPELSVIKKLGSLLRPYSGRMGALTVMGVFESLSEGLSVSLFIPFLASLDEETFSPEADNWLGTQLAQLFAAIPASNRLAVISLSIFALIFIRSLLSYGGTVIAAGIDRHLEHSLRDQIMSRLLHVDMSYLEHTRPGRLLNTLQDVTSTTMITIWTLFSLIVNLSMIGVFTAFLLLLSWKLTLFVGIALAAISLAVKLLTHRVEALSQSQLDADQDLKQSTLEILQGMRTIRAFTREDRERERFARISRRLSRIEADLHKISGLIGPVAQLLAGTLLILVLFTALQDPGNLSMVLVFIFILYRLHPQVMELDEGRNTLVAAAPEVEELMRILRETARPAVQSGAVVLDRLRTGIRFDGVSFRYGPEDRWAIEDVCLEIPRGKRIALAGPSGAGKSTLISLLLRFYDPQRGKITVNGAPLRDLDLESWRRRLAVVSQDTHIFNASIQDNIAYGRGNADLDEVIAAARQADAHEFISALPNGYDTLVGDQGIRLSGGQRQRIALARAIVRKADVLVLDEATNALDSISERAVLDSIQALGDECTVISIAHRLATIMQADEIIVLEAGRVKEQGHAAELLANQSLFARLYQLQEAAGDREETAGE